MAKTSKASNTRTRTWCFLSYVNPSEIEKALHEKADKGISIAWQTHDKDDGKKLHTHVVVTYPSVKSLTQVIADFDGLPANDYAEPARNTRAAIRYLAHIDNPEKHRYDNPRSLNWDIDNFLIDETSPDQRQVKNMLEILAFIRDNDISYYNDLLDLICDLMQIPEQEQTANRLMVIATNKRYITPILSYIKAKDTQEQRLKNLPHKMQEAI